ncbi:MAG TPA: hypothetical protein VM432_05735 [Bdellovibrionales bacterium]|jgi:hypothetical protein|nr:hypothetical protein [Bdellovibrionales bacterium]
MNNSAIKFLVCAIATFVSVVSAHAQSTPSQLLQELNRGIRLGNFETLSTDEQDRFLVLLSDARDLLNGGSSSTSYMCVHTGNNYYALSDSSTGKSYGSELYGLDACKATLPAPGSQFTCVHAGNNYYELTNLASNQSFGTELYSLASCKITLPKPNQVLACVHTGNNYYQVTNLRTSAKIGTEVYGSNACVRQLP